MKSSIASFSYRSCVAALMGLLLASSASAASWISNATVNPANTANWTNSTNWSGNVTPSGTTGLDTISFNTFAVINTTTNDFVGGNFTAITVGNVGNGFVVNGNALTLNGSNILTTGSLGNGFGSLTVNTDIALAGGITHTINAGTAQSITVTGVISGTDGLQTIGNSVGNGTVSLQGNNSYTGNTIVAGGVLNVNGVNGSIAGSSNITVGGTGATLNISNFSGNANRVKDTATLTLGGSTGAAIFTFTGNASASSSTETIGTLAIDKGTQLITLTGAGALQLQTLAFGNTTRANNGTALIRGTSLQTAATNSTRLLIDGGNGTGLTLVGAGTAAVGNSTVGTTKTLSIVPYFIGDTTTTGNGTSFLTYDTTSGTGGGLRPLAAGEYTTLNATYTTPGTVENVKAFNGTVLTASDVTVNSLMFSTANQTLTGSAGKLIVNSGAVASTATVTGTQVIGNGFSRLTLGNGVWNEGIITSTTLNTLTVNTPIDVTGGGGLTKSGNGTLVLGASNLYTGQTTLNQGTLIIGTGTAGDLGTNTAGIVMNGGTLSFNRTNSGLTISNVISGIGTLSENGTGGTTILTGNNTYTGATSIIAGTLQIGNGTDSGSIISTGSMTNNGTLAYNVGTGNRTISGVISGIGSVKQSGAGGVLTLSANNTMTGVFAISAGTLQFAKTGSLYNNTAASWTSSNITVASTGTLALNVGGTNEFTTGNVTTLLTNLGGANGTSTTGFAAGSSIGFNTTNSGGTFTVADIIANSTGSGGGSVGVVKLGTNTLILTGNSTYTGTTQIVSGTLQVGAGSDAGSIGTSGNIVNNGTLVNNVGAGTRSYANVISGIGALTQNSTGGTLTLSGNNTYSGTTTVSAGTLQAGVASVSNVSGAFGLNSAVVTGNVTGATLNLNNFSTQIGSLAGGGTNGGNVILGNATLTTGGDNTNPAAYAGIISGTGGLTKIGTGTQNLTGLNTYSGGTSVTGGTLNLGVSNTPSGAGTVSSGPIGTGNLTLSNGTSISAGSGVSVYLPRLNINGNITIAGTNRLILFTTVDLGGGNRTITLNKASSSYASGQEAIKFDGNTTFQSATGNVSTFQNGAVTFTTITGNATNPAIVRSGTSNNFVNNLSLTIDDGVAYSSGTSNAFATGSNAPALTLNAAVTRGGGILQMGDGSSSGNSVMRGVEVYSLSGGGTVSSSNTVGNATTGTLTINNGNGANFSGIITEAGGTGIIAVTKSGNGTQTLSGNNIYSGLTTVSAGTLTLSGNNSLSSGGVTISAGTLNVNNANALGSGTFTWSADSFLNNTSAAAVVNAGNNPVTLNNIGTVYTFGTSGSTSANNLDLGTGTVTASSSRRIDVLGTGVTLAMGTLDNQGAATSRTFTFNGAGNTIQLRGFRIANAASQTTTTLAGTADLLISGQIDNGASGFANTLAVTGNGTTTFNGNNIYTGLTTVASGSVLKIGNATALGTTDAGTTVSSGGKLDLNGQTTAEALNLSGTSATDALVNTAAGPATVTGAVTLGSAAVYINAGTNGSITLSGGVGDGGASKGIGLQGNGTVILSGASTYTGATKITAGTLLLGAANVINNSATNTIVLSGGTLQSAFSQNLALATLSLTASSTLNLSTGGIFAFADSSGSSWTGTLSIVGTFTDSSSVRFGSSNTGLSSVQLSQILINGSMASIDTGGYLFIAPVPEPATYAALAGALSLVGTIIYRRRRRSE